MNRKAKPLKQTVFLSEQCAVSKVTTSVRSAVFQPRHRPVIALLLIYCPVDNTIIRSQTRNSLFGCVKSLLFLWKTCSWF